MAGWFPCLACGAVLVRVAPGLDSRSPLRLCPACRQVGHPSPEEALACDLLTQWFQARYVAPVEVCPYESAEGGYAYLWGGPCDAYEVLVAAWETIFTPGFLAQVALQLCLAAETDVWSGHPEAPVHG